MYQYKKSLSSYKAAIYCRIIYIYIKAESLRTSRAATSICAKQRSENGFFFAYRVCNNIRMCVRVFEQCAHKKPATYKRWKIFVAITKKYVSPGGLFGKYLKKTRTSQNFYIQSVKGFRWRVRIGEWCGVTKTCIERWKFSNQRYRYTIKHLYKNYMGKITS